MRKILIVDDEVAMRMALREVLRRRGFETLEADGGPAALELLSQECGARLVLSDVRMPDMSGTELLRILRSRYPGLPVIVMTAFGAIEDAVEAMKAGASDYILKPFAGDAIVAAIERALKGVEAPPPPAAEGAATAEGDAILAGDSRPTHGAGRLVYADARMGRLLETLDEVSNSSATILLEGESGVGKEVFARYIHEKSPRREGPFVAVNCAALPEGLLESELFGHEKGSFTGAIQSRKGKFELANGGALLLDEISEMPLSLQAKLLRVLQEQEIDPIGSRAPVSIDIRVIATTNRDLTAAVRQGDFREDLFYRLNVIHVRVPALRERPADILPLAEHFLRKLCRRHHRPSRRLGREMIERLLAYSWPGNVRELENTIERAVLLCRDEEITPSAVFLDGLIASPAGFGERKTAAIEMVAAPRADRFIAGAAPSDDEDDAPFAVAGEDLGEIDGIMTLEQMERRLILSTLEKVGGNRTRAADLLGVSVRTIRNKLSVYREGASVAG